jgi:glycolate oxidase iron-sulfur subunit
MQTSLAPEFRDTREGQEAEAILRQCVHCGFCTATCPTYQILGDELDGPRGRIYLMKQVLEGAEVTRSTQQHLDRCLTCRNCETTCPSGVQYGRLVDIGRTIVDERVRRPAAEKAMRWMLREGLTSKLFPAAIELGRWARPLLPAALRNKIPGAHGAPQRTPPPREHARKVLMLRGCVQPTLMPNIDAATARVLDAAGIQPLVAERSGCCGALRTHLGDAQGGLADARRNIDAWWPWVDSGAVEAIVSNASACGLAVKEYGHALAHDAAYAERARRISRLARDIGELLPDLVPRLRHRLRPGARPRLAYHPPCTLQHGQGLRGGVEAGLASLGFDVQQAAVESHLCCGSSGTYSVLQPEMAYALRDRKLQHLAAVEAQTIVSANIGCIQHLQSGTATPVRHWIEVLAELLDDEDGAPGAQAAGG